MTHDEARQIIREHYSNIANESDIYLLRQAVRYLSNMVAEHMTWDSAIEMAKWLNAQDAQR